MNKVPHLVENLPTQFLYGKNCSSAMWMKYSIYCGTPSAPGGGWEERVAFMEFGYSAKRGVLLQLQLGWLLGAQQGQGWLCRGSEASTLGEGFQRLLIFHRRPQHVMPCVEATVTTLLERFPVDPWCSWTGHCWVSLPRALFQHSHHLPSQWGISWSRSRNWMSVRWLVEFSSFCWEREWESYSSPTWRCNSRRKGRDRPGWWRWYSAGCRLGLGPWNRIALGRPETWDAQLYLCALDFFIFCWT